MFPEFYMSFIVASLTLRSLILFEVCVFLFFFFWYGVRERFNFNLYTFSCPDFPARMTEMTVLSLLYSLASFAVD